MKAGTTPGVEELVMYGDGPRVGVIEAATYLSRWARYRGSVSSLKTRKLNILVSYDKHFLTHKDLLNLALMLEGKEAGCQQSQDGQDKMVAVEAHPREPGGRPD